MKCSLGISNFLEEISSLSHSIVFLYFFALFIEEGLLISPCYSLELSCFSDDPADVGNLIFGCSDFSKTNLKIWKFSVHILFKPTWRILSVTLLVCGMSAIVWYRILWCCLSFGLEWKLTFSSPVATAEFSKFAGLLSAALSQHHLSGFEIAQLELNHLN